MTYSHCNHRFPTIYGVGARTKMLFNHKCYRLFLLALWHLLPFHNGDNMVMSRSVAFYTWSKSTADPVQFVMEDYSLDGTFEDSEPLSCTVGRLMAHRTG